MSLEAKASEQMCQTVMEQLELKSKGFRVKKDHELCICLCSLCTAFYQKQGGTSCGCTLCDAVLAAHVSQKEN